MRYTRKVQHVYYFLSTSKGSSNELFFSSKGTTGTWSPLSAGALERV